MSYIPTHLVNKFFLNFVKDMSHKKAVNATAFYARAVDTHYKFNFHSAIK